METIKLDENLKKDILRFQREELTGARLYGFLAKRIKDTKNAAVLEDMAKAENGHYSFWKKLSGADAPPYKARVFFLSLAARVLGLTFALKLLEKGEDHAAEGYAKVRHLFPEAVEFGKEEEAHEEALIAMIDEERLAYVGSIVLGLNDALVELTGTLAGLTFALQRGSIVAISGIITGIAAAFSMAASDYLASKAEGDPRAKKSAIYTGVAYIITVVLLVLPYLLLPQRGGWIYLSLAITLLIAIGIIAGFNYYLAVAKDQNFKAKFLEMAAISLGVAAFSFVVGLIVRAAFGVDI
jgi:VIT1/CCC1 family predicted Fe2+/Mn2+ transporter